MRIQTKLGHPRLALLCGAVLAVTAGPALAQTTTTPATPATPASPVTATSATPATPATPAAPATVGMAVKDAAGGTVGTVTAVSDGFVTVKTDKHEAKLPAASFAAANGGLVYGMTQAQLNTQIDTQAAAAAAQFKTGATVKGTDGAELASVTALDADTVTLKLKSGKAVRVPRTGLAGSADGLVIGMTAAELDAAAGTAKASSSTTTKTTTTTKTKTKAKSK